MGFENIFHDTIYTAKINYVVVFSLTCVSYVIVP
jgi:hypothetical protein